MKKAIIDAGLETEDLDEYRTDYPGGREPGNEEAIVAWEKEEARRKRMEARATAEEADEENSEEEGLARET